MWQSTLKAATPVGAATQSWFCRSSLRQWMRYDFPVPETIILRGGGLSALKCSCTVVYTSSCLP